jgi:hypothetical protein
MGEAARAGRGLQPALALGIALVLLLGMGVTAAWRSVGGRAAPTGRVVFQDGRLSITHTATHERLHIAYARDGRMYAIEDHFVYVSEDSGSSFRQLGRLPKVDASLAARLADRLARLSLVRRWRQNPGPSSLVVLSTGTVLAFYDHIYRLAAGERVFTPVQSLLDGVHAPFPHGIAVTPDDQVFFGEYAVDPSRPARRILRGRADGRRWDVVHTFPQGAVSHVHHIQYDPVRARLWIATGDSDCESGLFFTDDRLASIRTLGRGSQDWRMASLIVTDRHLFWGTDNDRTGAGVFRWSFADGRLTRLVDIGNPSYFSTRLRDGTLAVSTTYEPDSPYTHDFAPEPATDLWLSRDGSRWHRVLRLGYRERRVGHYAARASIHLSPGDGSAAALVFSPFDTTRWHFTTQRWQVAW